MCPYLRLRMNILQQEVVVLINLDETNARKCNVQQDVMTVYYDNLSAINISKNPIPHSRTKHIDIHHDFIRDLVEEKLYLLSM